MRFLSKSKPTLLFIASTLLLSACSLSLSTDKETTPSAIPIITATLPPTLTPRPSATPLPPTPVPTIPPIGGIATTQVNIRSAPNTASQTLGMLNNGASVQIIGKDVSEAWYQIIYADGPEGIGWVSAAYIRATAGAEIPVIGAGAGPTSDGGSGLVTQKINVRSGPGTNYDALGMLNPQDVVTLTGKNASGTWLQIEFADGPDGRGWISAGYIQASGMENLPIVGETGQVIGTGTPTTVPATLTPTVVPAPSDDDSRQSPAIDITFSTTESRAFSYSSDVSSPEGDPEDWIAFTPNSTQSDIVTLYLDLTCAGNGKLLVELWQGNEKLDNWGALTCGASDYELVLFRNETYQFRMRAKSGNALQYVNYTLTISTQ
ncbi:MAG: SH3 domain-containing protein [Chloroflexi bacterium]|nr:SH3 domain-containing protein [Chloroflexota bacterium]